jgi:hypothetical protein
VCNLEKTKKKMTVKQNYRFITTLFILFLISSLLVKGQESGKFFSFNQISEMDYRKAINDNFNAIPVQLNDSVRLENALQEIDKTYSQHEIDLAGSELCKSPRCLTSFERYYPNLDILVFFIQDYHFENAVFLKGDKDFLDTRLERINGSFGVMSKKGLWVGLERNDCDNYLQIEICEITKRGTWSIIRFDFKTIDINEDEKEPIFWVNENTIYLATIEFSNTANSGLKKYYEIKFDK